jgi:hypothetical protein
VSELFERILREVRDRLDESRRAVEEYERLQRALAALDNGAAHRPGHGPTRSTRSRTRRGQPAAARRSEAVANRRKLLSVIGERPGVTREELRATTALSGSAVAQNLRRAVAAGQVRERTLPGGQVGYSLVSAGGLPTDAASSAS